MKTIERILLKIIVIQLIFLLLTQLIFHKAQTFPELNQLTQYEGVTDPSATKFLETFSDE